MSDIFFTKNQKCRLCGSGRLEMFLKLPEVALAGNPSAEPSRGRERLFALNAYRCEECGLIQLADIVSSDIYKDYTYTPAHSESFKNYARWLCGDIFSKFSPRTVIEIGSGDGFLINEFARAGASAAGFEPSAKLASDCASGGGAFIINDYFGRGSIARLPGEFTRRGADAVIIRHVMEHLNDFDAVMEPICSALDETKGVLAIEVPYAADIISQNQFYAFFQEHISYFSFDTLSKLLKKYGLFVIDALTNGLEGGSILIYAGFEKNRGRYPSYQIPPSFYEDDKLTDISNLRSFSAKVKSYCDGFREFLSAARSRGARFCAWGAGQRGVSLINICALTSSDINFVIDVNPLYQGKFIPGTDIPVKPPSELDSRNDINAVVIFATGYARDIMSSNLSFTARGGRFASIIPEAGWYR